MANSENAVWQAFRSINEPALHALYFNVHCGTVPGLTTSTPEEENRIRSALWSKRVDVVAETATEVWLIEVKANARPSSVGQTLTYRGLIGARKVNWNAPRLMLVAGTFDPDALALCGELGLECFAPPFRLLAPAPRSSSEA